MPSQICKQIYHSILYVHMRTTANRKHKMRGNVVFATFSFWTFFSSSRTKLSQVDKWIYCNLNRILLFSLFRTLLFIVMMVRISVADNALKWIYKLSQSAQLQWNRKNRHCSQPSSILMHLPHTTRNCSSNLYHLFLLFYTFLNYILSNLTDCYV